MDAKAQSSVFKGLQNGIGSQFCLALLTTFLLFMFYLFGVRLG